MNRLFRYWDKNGCPCLGCKKSVKTSTKTLNAYTALYSGPEFDIHYQYSNILVITWVTFLFGPGLPILFPLAFLGMIILYCTNRLTLAYFHRRPPVYDQRLNETTLYLLRFAPLLYTFMGAWVYSNQQTFRNKVTANTNGEPFMQSQHTVDEFFTQVNPGTVFIGYIILVLVWIVAGWLIKAFEIESLYSMRTRIGSYKVEQKLQNYFAAMSTKDRNSLIREEVINYTRLGIINMSKEALEKLVLADRCCAKHQRLKGDVSYRILRH